MTKETNEETSSEADDDGVVNTQELVTTGEQMTGIARSEIFAQVEVAHRFPRVISKFRKDVLSLATMSREIAEKCQYSLERKDKNGRKTFIVGPSIRMAEIVAASYRNIKAGSRVEDVGEFSVTAVGVAWDTESNVHVSTEVKRRITTKEGNRFNDDLIIVTMNAAQSIAYRNAIFRLIPRAVIADVIEKVKAVASGKGMTLIERRAYVLKKAEAFGVTAARASSYVGAATPEDLTEEHIEILIGLVARLVEKEPVDSVFTPEAGGSNGNAPPPPGAGEAEQGRRSSMRTDKPKDSNGAATAATAGEVPDEVSAAAAKRAAAKEAKATPPEEAKTEGPKVSSAVLAKRKMLERFIKAASADMTEFCANNFDGARLEELTEEQLDQAIRTVQAWK